MVPELAHLLADDHRRQIADHLTDARRRRRLSPPRWRAWRGRRRIVGSRSGAGTDQHDPAIGP